MEPAGDITVLLREWRDGYPDAFNRLLPLAYNDLRGIAAAYLRHEADAGTLQATSLVHELYMRLVDQRKAEWTDRGHFFAFSAKLMRMILIDHAREQHAKKRGGGAVAVPLSDDLPWLDASGPDMLDLDRALNELETIDPRKVRLVELRHMLGCTAEEAAEILGVSKATVDRDDRMIKAWLFQRLRGSSKQT